MENLHWSCGEKDWSSFGNPRLPWRAHHTLHIKLIHTVLRLRLSGLERTREQGREQTNKSVLRLFESVRPPEGGGQTSLRNYGAWYSLGFRFRGWRRSRRCWGVDWSGPRGRNVQLDLFLLGLLFFSATSISISHDIHLPLFKSGFVDDPSRIRRSADSYRNILLHSSLNVGIGGFLNAEVRGQMGIVLALHSSKVAKISDQSRR